MRLIASKYKAGTEQSHMAGDHLPASVSIPHGNISLKELISREKLIRGREMRLEEQGERESRTSVREKEQNRMKGSPLKYKDGLLSRFGELSRD